MSDSATADSNDLIRLRPEGLYCPLGDFFIDPSRPVPRAVITHAHGDHARSGSGRYWAAAPGLGLLRERLGRGAAIEALAYGQAFPMGGVSVSLHPAGHVLGSAQVRIEHRGKVWVVSGDYKRDPDPSCAPFEVVPCDVFITEATFALPVYQWPAPGVVAAEIFEWWQHCAARGETALLLCYALGKAQRILAELRAFSTENVYLHGAMSGLVQAYREAGIALLPTVPVSSLPRDFDWHGKLVLAPPSAAGTSWIKRFMPPHSAGVSTGFASGWMRVRGNRRRQAWDRGFVMSDHADWESLLRTVRETGARRVLTMHGHSDALIAVLREQGLDAQELFNPFAGKDSAAAAADTTTED